MRKLLFIIFVLFNINAKSQTSVYHSFPDSNAVWNMLSHSTCSSLIGTRTEMFSYHLEGDTIINSISYKKLSVPVIMVDVVGLCTPSGNWMDPGYYAGSTRSDSTSKKVFFIPPTDSVEQLLYDFNLNIGDTVRGFLQSWANPDDVVISTDSVLVGNNYRKRWFINSYYNIYVIEGIGSTYGLLQLSPGVALIDGYDVTLNCFSENSITLYPTAVSNCELITSFNDLSLNVSQISISPNPFQTSATIQVGPEFENGTLKIYNSLGAVVKEVKLNQRNYLLNKNNLPNGIYFLELINNKNNHNTVKFIID